MIDHEPVIDAGVVPALEPERYELFEPARYHFDVDRRGFLKILTAMGGGLLIVSSLPASAQETGRAGAQGAAANGLASWIHIGGDGHVTAYTGKVEIGQNIRTSLAQTVADELRVSLAMVSFVMADTELTPFDAGTFGSRTTPTMAPQLAKAAATAREVLIDLAAARWQADRATLTAANGAVTNATHQSLTYGALTQGQNLTGVVPARANEQARDQWAIRGQAPHKINGRDFVTGKHQYAPDIVRPNMLIGRVVRPAALGATLQSVDDARARAMAGVTVVRDGEFIGVTAPNERAAKAAAAAIVADWKLPTGLPDSDTIFDHLEKTATAAGGGGGRGAGGGGGAGDVAGARGRLGESVHREISDSVHRARAARAAGGRCRMDRRQVDGVDRHAAAVRRAVGYRAGAPHSRRSRARDRAGHGIGLRRQTHERRGDRSREAGEGGGQAGEDRLHAGEEFMWGYVRPAGVIAISAGVDAAGKLSFWEFDNYNSGNSGLNTPYAVPNRREAFHNADSPLKQGSYRGLAATANHHAREMHMDAIARVLGVDAVEFRLKHITEPRLAAVLRSVAEKSGWPKPSTPGRSLGIACGTEKGSYIATAAEVSRTPDGFKIERLVAAFECGAIVNPDGLRNQVEGAIVQGLGGALFETLRFSDGKLLNGTMAEYRVPRFKDVPPLDVTLIDRRDLPSAGAGETPIVCVAPAIGSAVRAFGTVPDALPVVLKA